MRLLAQTPAGKQIIHSSGTVLWAGQSHSIRLLSLHVIVQCLAQTCNPTPGAPDQSLRLAVRVAGLALPQE